MSESKRKQLNLRLDPETEERLARLLVVVSGAIGIPVSQAELIRLALIELEKRYAEPKPRKSKDPS